MCVDLLSDILCRLELTGTLYFRTSFTSPWGVRVPSFRNVARFHFAHKGGCFVRVAGASNLVVLGQGDLIIIPGGAEHTLFCDPNSEGQAIALDTVVEESGFTGHGALVYGEPGSHQETQLVCGHFAFDEEASHPLIDALPACIHIENHSETAGRWMDSTLSVIGEETARGGVGGDFIAIRMAEIIFAQALRSYLANEGADQPVLSAFTDKNIAPVLGVIHADPSRRLTLEFLSRVAGMSRTSFIAKFSESLSMTPLKYVTFWRMQFARQQLLRSERSLLVIAEAVGYQSESAFSRVFKKHHGVAPATYRRRNRLQKA